MKPTIKYKVIAKYEGCQYRFSSSDDVEKKTITKSFRSIDEVLEWLIKHKNLDDGYRYYKLVSYKTYEIIKTEVEIKTILNSNTTRFFPCGFDKEQIKQYYKEWECIDKQCSLYDVCEHKLSQNQ